MTLEGSSAGGATFPGGFDDGSAGGASHDDTTMTVEEAQRFIAEAETLPLEAVHWERLATAADVLRQVVTIGSDDGFIAHQWLDRALTLVHRKVMPSIAALRSDEGTPEDDATLTRAADIVLGGAAEARTKVGQAILDEIGTLRATVSGGAAGGSSFAPSAEDAIAILDRFEADPASVTARELDGALFALQNDRTVAPGIQSRAATIQMEQAAKGRRTPGGVTPGDRGAAAPPAASGDASASASRQGRSTAGQSTFEVENRARAEEQAEALARVEREFRSAATQAGIPSIDVENAWAQVQTAPSLGIPVEQAAQEQIAVWQQMARDALGDAIGVPNDFVALREDPTVQAGGGDGLERWRIRSGREQPTRQTEVNPRYFDGDEFSPASLPAEERAELQAALVEAGVLEDGTFWTGEWDEGTVDAYRTVLGYANMWGSTPEETIDRLTKSLPAEMRADGGTGASGATFSPAAYQKPDYATLAQSVKAMFRSRVGRDPNEVELSQLAGELSGFYKAQYDADVAAQRATFEAGEQAAETGTEVVPAAGVNVNPAARFAELFESRFKPEIDRLDSLDDVRANTENVFSSLRTMKSLIGG